MTKDEGLHQITSVPANTFIQFARADGQTNENVPVGGRNDIFTKYLLENITKENTDIRDIFRSVSDGVRRESNGKQEVLCMIGSEQELKDVFLNEVKSMYELLYVSHHRTCFMSRGVALTFLVSGVLFNLLYCFLLPSNKQTSGCCRTQ